MSELDFPFLKKCRALWKAMGGNDNFTGSVGLDWSTMEYVIFNLEQEGYKIVPVEPEVTEREKIIYSARPEVLIRASLASAVHPISNKKMARDIIKDLKDCGYVIIESDWETEGGRIHRAHIKGSLT